MTSFDFSWMVGRHVRVSFLDPAIWYFTLDDSLSIGVECPWRLLHAGTIAVSNEDHLQQFGLPVPIDAVERANALLAGLLIQRVELREGTADLFIDFGGDYRLEIIPFSSGYESWQVSTPSGKSVVAQGGGNIYEW